MSTLWKRVLSALVLAPLVVLAVLVLPNPWVAGLLGAIVLLGAMEWARLSGLDSEKSQLIWTGALAVAIGVVALLQREIGISLILLGAAWWLLTLLRLLLAARHPVEAARGVHWPRLLDGFFVLLPAWYALTKIHGLMHIGPFLLLYCLILIWGADSFAYFSGRAFGRHKLAPNISPGKTLEGVAGALLGALVIAWVGHGLVARSYQVGLWPWLALGLIVVLASIAGDLFESLVKRERGMKDSGTLIPGHGGVMDRIDSLTAAGPVFAAGLVLLGVLQ